MFQALVCTTQDMKRTTQALVCTFQALKHKNNRHLQT